MRLKSKQSIASTIVPVIVFFVHYKNVFIQRQDFINVGIISFSLILIAVIYFLFLACKEKESRAIISLLETIILFINLLTTSMMLFSEKTLLIIFVISSVYLCVKFRSIDKQSVKRM